VTSTTKFNPNELAEARRIVVPDGLSISEGFKDRVGPQYLLR
jgi:hypothetical protein